MTFLQVAVTALVIVPVLALGRWYRGRLEQVKEAQREQDRTIADVWIAPTDLERRVTREGWLVLAAALVYWGLLSLIF